MSKTTISSFLIGATISYSLIKLSRNLVISFLLIVYQINTRDFDFDYKGHTSKFHEYEAKSMEVQKEILGDKLFNCMNKVDNELEISF